MAYPTVRAYDPAYVYEVAVIMLEGMDRMFAKGEDWIYYVTVYNENYEMPSMPEGCEEGILKGMYKLRDVSAKKPVSRMPHVNLFGSGAILREVLRAADMLAESWGVNSTVWSVTSWKELRRYAQEARRWNMLHPEESPQTSFLEDVLADAEGVFVAASDHVSGCFQSNLTLGFPAGLFVLGTDGFGRSETREAVASAFRSRCRMHRGWNAVPVGKAGGNWR